MTPAAVYPADLTERIECRSRGGSRAVHDYQPLSRKRLRFGWLASASCITRIIELIVSSLELAQFPRLLENHVGDGGNAIEAAAYFLEAVLIRGMI